MAGNLAFPSADALILHNRVLLEAAEVVCEAARDVIARAMTLRQATRTMRRRMAAIKQERHTMQERGLPQ
jgi:hypothetical protein